MKDLQYQALACPVCHCLHKVRKEEFYLEVLKCHCCGESLGSAKKETLYYPKGGYALYMLKRDGRLGQPVTTMGNMTHVSMIQTLTDWWGIKELERLVKQMEDTGIVFNQRNTFALKRVAD